MKPKDLVPNPNSDTTYMTLENVPNFSSSQLSHLVDRDSNITKIVL